MSYINRNVYKIVTISSFPSGVRSVDLSGNRIKKIDAFPPEMTEATTLNLAHNQITFIEYDAFDNLDELLNLDLSYNKLQNFEDDVFEWNPLKETRDKIYFLESNAYLVQTAIYDYIIISDHFRFEVDRK